MTQQPITFFTQQNLKYLVETYKTFDDKPITSELLDKYNQEVLVLGSIVSLKDSENNTYIFIKFQGGIVQIQLLEVTENNEKSIYAFIDEKTKVLFAKDAKIDPVKFKNDIFKELVWQKLSTLKTFFTIQTYESIDFGNYEAMDGNKEIDFKKVLTEYLLLMCRQSDSKKKFLFVLFDQIIIQLEVLDDQNLQYVEICDFNGNVIDLTVGKDDQLLVNIDESVLAMVKLLLQVIP